MKVEKKSSFEIMDYKQYKWGIADEVHYGFEGLKINVYTLNGKVYREWRSYSNILDEPYLRHQYYLCGGPSDTDLYDDDDVKTKYEFLMVIPDLFLYSKHSFQHGFMVLLRGRGNNLQLIRNWEGLGQKAGVYEYTKIDEKRAEHYLKLGFYPRSVIGTMDEDLWPGEFIYARIGQQLYKVESAGYQYRKTICGKPDNYVQRFLQLTDLTFVNHRDVMRLQQQTKTQYSARFKNLTHVKEAEVRGALQAGDLICWNEALESDEGLDTQRDRIYNLWLNLLGAVPLRHQPYVCKLFPGYYEDRQQLIRWLTQLKMGEVTFKMSPKLSTMLSKIRVDNKQHLTKQIADTLTCELGLNVYQYQLEYHKYLSQSAPSINPSQHQNQIHRVWSRQG